MIPRQARHTSYGRKVVLASSKVIVHSVGVGLAAAGVLVRVGVFVFDGTAVFDGRGVAVGPPGVWVGNGVLVRVDVGVLVGV
jgi:hypothetical protein